MPGTRILTGTRPGGSNLGAAPGAAFMVAGLTERGPTDRAVKVRSLVEYEAVYGARVSYGAVRDALEAFFNENGTEAWVARVVGAAATKGTLVLVDRSGGAGVSTLTVNAKNAGAWSSQVSIQVDDAPATNMVKITVLLGGVPVEVYNNIPDPATAAAIITAQSSLVDVVNNGSVSVAPTNNPKVLAATALSAGADDRATVTAATVAAAAVARFTPDLGAGIVATPGYTADLVGPTLLPDALAKGRLVALAPAAGATAAGVRTAVAALRGIAGSECAGVFYPWVQVPDGSGGLRTISPEGTVAGLRARTQVLEGPWQAPAGAFGISRFVVGLETVLDRATADALNDDGVSCLRVIAGGVRLYGWRSLSNDAANYRFLNARDVMNYVGALGNAALEQFVFRTIDGKGQLFSDAAAAVKGIVEPLRAAGGLYELHAGGTPAGDLIDPGYRIDTGPGVNTPVTIAAGEVRVAVGLRPSPVGELVTLILTRVSMAQAA